MLCIASGLLPWSPLEVSFSHSKHLVCPLSLSFGGHMTVFSVFRVVLLTIGSFLLVAGCSQPSEPAKPATSGRDVISIERLRMPPPEAFEVEKIEIKSIVQASQAPTLFKQEGLVSSAYYKYWRPDGSAYKVRLNIYESRPDLQHGWDKRFPPETLTGTTSLGADVSGFIQGEKIAATQVDTVLVEVTTSKGAPRLAEFTRQYTAYVQDIWQRD